MTFLKIFKQYLTQIYEGAMKSKHFNIRVTEKEKLEIEKFVREKTDFDNVSDYFRILIRRAMRRNKQLSNNQESL